jgi:hypothetical protein
MRDLAELERARRDGSIYQRLRALVRRQRDDANCLRELGFLSPHLTKEEKDYCRMVDLQSRDL